MLMSIVGAAYVSVVYFTYGVLKNILAMASCDRCEKICAIICRSYCDLELVCGDGGSIPVHKIIVFSQSDVIKETYHEDWGHEIYIIPEYGFEDLQRLVDYLYTGDYETMPSDSSETQDKASELIAHGNLLGLAFEYGVPGLLHLSMERSRAAIRDEPETSALIECIPKVYESVIDPDRKMFKIILDTIRERIGSIPLDLNTRYMF
ncbi:hypothetical protein TsFJ059_004736 [Trichoderma semiorbis]|uniref:BTB domain-containing protein n=1 Tax=Trichoderma semiorbis TaxID=1491008 RepID=A0A9P8KQA4_9HYPO|nr:hypothetical protein TsFJ059_004736 [Trichoderma semiorbis]